MRCAEPRLAVYLLRTMFSDLKGPIALLAIMLGVLAALYLWFIVAGAPGKDASPIAEEFVPGSPSPEVRAQLEKSRGFEVLISYTDIGFEPSEAAINRGESVRFTNNSSHDLWVASEGTTQNPIYPGRSECGGSPFDSCRALAPREFWEFTFEESGTWLFRNNLDKEQSGAVRVQVK